MTARTSRSKNNSRENRINVANRTVFHGDNLKFLRGINSGTVHLIATDPPFNKSKDFHATHDSLAYGARFSDRWKWDVDVHSEWVDAIQDDLPAVWKVIEAAKDASGDNMAAFLCWLGVRLLEMRRVLRDDGSIYLHIDHTAQAWVKALMDGIFGLKNFRNELIWERTVSRNDGKQFGRTHDSILYYSKSARRTWNPVYQPLNEGGAKAYKYDDRDGKGPYSLSNITNPHPGGYVYDLGYGEKLPKNGYRMTEERAREWMDEGRLVVRRGRVPRRKQYLNESNGVKLGSVWHDIRVLSSHDRERTGYPTQKPLALYERIIKASSNPGDIVLDPFAGCATTPVAAERLGRRWIGMDLWEGAHDMVLKRLQSEGLAVDGRMDGQLLTFGDVHYSTAPPIRSDDNDVAAPDLKLKEHFEEPGDRMTRAAMKEKLIDAHGMVCQGCDRVFDDPLYLELDHKTPRSEGGINHISNRVLLCGPCNRIKSNTLTLTGLRRRNAELGRMSG